ncbi:MAG TPA: two-component sensor histidine kinase [Candidatus Blautia merdigallinarum]|uniref:histidine kinase n=1 Tax=Candidatus Blautia merdigallinarum TaxID=2838495 RepID=A0A9D2N8W3_9FIRM|nr:two-component sensor histidine kinase [Candidatus Blautia merdigallinarum]
MRQKIMNHVTVLVVLSVLLTYLAASLVMYHKYRGDMEADVIKEAEYIRYALENVGEEYLEKDLGQLTTSRITVINSQGEAVYDSNPEGNQEDFQELQEFQKAREEGKGQALRFSDTLSRQTFYYAVRLDDGDILRVGKTTDSIFQTMVSSFTLLGIIMILILVLGFLYTKHQTKKLIEPINQLDLENPLKNVVYEELRPLLNRVDQQNRQIASHVEELQQAEKVRREFSANVSHELKTPLMSISGYAEIMKNGMVRQEDVPEFAARIYDEAARLSSLVQDIIELSKLDEKSGELPLEVVDLYELVQDICRNLTLPASKKNISIQTEGSSVKIQGVRHVLYEMFYNLVDNAVKYNHEGGWVKVSLKQTEEGAEFAVKDSGIGIAREEQDRIFERFYRVDKSHSRKTGGTGLGLSIVKHGAALHHAQIRLDSRLGEGTSIRISFRVPKEREE